jgi:hypothetical protein
LLPTGLQTATDYVATISARVKRHNGKDFEQRKDVDLYHGIVGEIITVI